MARSSLLVVFFALFAAAAADAQPKHSRPPETRPNTAAWERFLRERGPAWRVRWNPITGTPHRVSGSTLTLQRPVNKNNVESVTREFIAQNQDLLGVDVKGLVFAGATFEPPVKGGRSDGTWRVVFHQTHGGIPVPGGSVRLTIRHKSITSFGADFFRDIDVPTQPVISEFQAGDIALRDMSSSGEPLQSRLTVFADARGETLRYYLAWELLMPVVHIPDHQGSDGAVVPIQWRYVIDAVTGRILDRANLMIHATVSGQVTGTIRPVNPADPPAVVPLPNLRVTATQGGVASTTDTDPSGNYTFGGLTGAAATITAQLAGQHVVVYNNETPNPDTTHTGSVTAPATHDWNFAADDPSPNDVEENAYYHTDRIRQFFLRGTPFNVSPQPDPMDVFVRDGAYANASAGPSGLYFGYGSEDFALCADLIYHEYTHRIVDSVYTTAGVVLPYSGQTGAMNEAWADYFGASLTNDPWVGESCFGGRDIAANWRYPGAFIGQVHHDSVIFSGAIWDVRSALGATYGDALALRAMKQAALTFDEYLNAMLEEDDDPSFNPSPVADGNLANGTPNIGTICNAFYDLHGIWDVNCARQTQTVVAIITDPLPTRVTMLPPASASIVITGSAVGSINGFQRFTVEYAHESAPGTFLSAGVALAGGGLAPVNDATLAVLNTTALADGLYTIRLTVTDPAGVTGIAMALVSIDRTLKPGWPQASAAHFFGSPAVADLDPERRGLEIAARSDDGMLHVWRDDGTALPGFPLWSGGWFASPAMADIVPGDGRMEIVILDDWSGHVQVYRHDGSVAPGWPQPCPGGFRRVSPAIGDLDGDGRLEIVVGSQGNRICAWHGDGTVVAGWPVTTSDKIYSSVAIADLDSDGTSEVVAGAVDGNIYVLLANGTPFSGWPISLRREASVSPAIGDLDGDGDLEIVTGVWDLPSWTSSVIAFHHTGTVLSGWPQRFPGILSEPSSLVLADLDTDGSLDVVAQLAETIIHAWQADGASLPGWPTPASFAGYELHPSSPAVADVDGDGIADLISEGASLYTITTFVSQVFGHRPNGTIFRRWTIPENGSSPVVADIDRDGRGELLVGSRGVLVWNLNRPFTNGPREWPAYRHDAMRTGTVNLGGQQNQPVIDVNAGLLAIGGASQQRLAQTVTAGLVGHLTEVMLPVSCAAGSDLTLTIERVSSGMPSGAILSTQVIPGSTLGSPAPVFRRFSIATPPLVFPTDEFAIVLTSNGTCATYQGPVGDPYPRGNLFYDALPNTPGVWICGCTIAGSAFDLPFKTFVGP